jgi:eukaryotic-like serine/threonine-protein kinase
MATLRAGALLARRYRLIDPIGAGGMSIIWRARDELLDRMVAIKVLTSELAADAKFRDLVREEARAAAQLVHPHVTAVHDYGEAVGADGSITAFVVMELLSGEELEARLTAGPLPWQEAVEICTEVAEALAAAHRMGIVHRDVTPANIMLTANGAKVLDFGIATHVGAPDEDEEGDTFGTPAYVAPERLDGVPAQPATDTYSLGVLLFETLTGRVPYPADTWDDLARAQPGGPMPPLEVAGLPSGIVDICRRCLSRDPRERPTAHQVGEALREQLLPADPHATTMLAPTVTLPTLFPAPRHAADLGPVALASLTGGTATLVGGASGPLPSPTAYGIGVATPPGPPSFPGGGPPSDPGRLGPAPTRTPPRDPGWPSDPGPPTEPYPGRGVGPPTEPGRHAVEPRRRRGWTPVRAGLAVIGSVGALAAALLVGLNLGGANDPPGTLQATGPEVASQPTAGVGSAPTPAATPSAGLQPPLAAATPTQAPTKTPPAQLTVRQAVNALGDVIDDGLADDGGIRRDAGIDLQHLVNNMREGLTNGTLDVDREVASLRQKVAARAKESAISPKYATRLNNALDQLANAR